MKNNVLFFILSLFFAHSFSQEIKYIEVNNFDFKPNEIVYLFGNDVKFRTSPSTESEVIDILKINSRIKIISKVEASFNYNGIDWEWYKVSYDNKTGYIIGGLLSLDQKVIGDSVYLISLEKKEKEFSLLIRLVNKQSLEYVELPYKLGNASTFSIEAYNNRGLSGIKDMLLVDFMAEACGVDGGGCYFFNDGKTLIRAIEFSKISEAGIFWLDEEVVFPMNNKEKENIIVFKSEHGEVIDEESNHKKIISETKEFVWKGVFLEFKKAKSE